MPQTFPRPTFRLTRWSTDGHDWPEHVTRPIVDRRAAVAPPVGGQRPVPGPGGRR